MQDFLIIIFYHRTGIDKSELLRKHRISLEKVVTQNMTWLAHKMNSSGLLPDETHSDVINPRSMLTEAQKATNIVQSLKKKVDIDRSNWDKFVEILKQEPLYSDILTLFSHEPVSVNIKMCLFLYL